MYIVFIFVYSSSSRQSLEDKEIAKQNTFQTNNFKEGISDRDNMKNLLSFQTET